MSRSLTASEATGRRWCLWCPDLVLPGEIVATCDGLLDPLGEPGYVHADCALRNGYEVAGYREPVDAEAVLRKAFRDGHHRGGDGVMTAGGGCPTCGCTCRTAGPAHCTCGDAEALHAFGRRDGVTVRTYCSRSGCTCREFVKAVRGRG